MIALDCIKVCRVQEFQGKRFMCEVDHLPLFDGEHSSNFYSRNTGTSQAGNGANTSVTVNDFVGTGDFNDVVRPGVHQSVKRDFPQDPAKWMVKGGLWRDANGAPSMKG